MPRWMDGEVARDDNCGSEGRMEAKTGTEDGGHRDSYLSCGAAAAPCRYRDLNWPHVGCVAGVGPSQKFPIYRIGAPSAGGAPQISRVKMSPLGVIASAKLSVPVPVAIHPVTGLRNCAEAFRAPRW